MDDDGMMEPEEIEAAEIAIGCLSLLCLLMVLAGLGAWAWLVVAAIRWIIG